MGKRLSKFSNIDIKAKENLIKNHNDNSCEKIYLNLKNTSNRSSIIILKLVESDLFQSEYIPNRISKISKDNKSNLNSNDYSDPSSNLTQSITFQQLLEEDKQIENKIISSNFNNNITFKQIPELSENIKLLKKINSELEDFELISCCMSKHFFMRVLDQRAM
jgi:hypothetical protein